MAYTHPRKFAKDPKTIRAAKTIIYFLATIVNDAPKSAKMASRFVMTTGGVVGFHFPAPPAGHHTPHKEALPVLKRPAKAPVKPHQFPHTTQYLDA
jgi:hypothetical protein